MPWVSPSEYAKMRGVSAPRITHLYKTGRFAGATRKKGKRYEIDSDRADKLLESSLDAVKWENSQGDKDKSQPDIGSKIPGYTDLNEARRLHEIAKAAIKQLEYKEKSGQLLNADEVKRAAFERGRAVRDAMLNIPDRISSILAAESDPLKVAELLLDEINQALEALVK